MTPALRWLIWMAVLVTGLTVALDWQDELNKLRPERARIEQLRQRAEGAMQGINWAQQEELARQAQLSWLNRLPEVTQMGVFRAEAMEAMSDLCNRLAARCQVAAMGESSSISRESDSRIDARTTPPISGLVSTSLRLTVDLVGDKLIPILHEIESGPVLRNIEKFTVRSGRADLIVKTFGIESSAATAVRNLADGKVNQISNAASLEAARAAGSR